MLLTSQIILVTSFCIYISADVSMTQIKTSIIKKEGNTAFLECQVKSAAQKKNRYLHWYRQKSEEPLQRILYISSNENVIHEPGFSVEKYEARKLQSELLASLRIHQTQEEDTDGNTEVRISQNQSKTARPDKVVRISCKLSGIAVDNVIVHWYEQKEGEPLKRILYSSTKNFIKDNFNPRLESEKSNGIFYLIINTVIESDEAIYYCACWDFTMSQSGKQPDESIYLIKHLNDQISQNLYQSLKKEEKNLDGDLSPKPTVFLPSPAEVSLHQSGTYLCLLEKFFPEVIKIDWKEENSNKMVESQQGNVVKTGDTYMKFSWLTVTENSLDKKHKCIVKHEFNRGGVDQEIIFPSIKEDVTPDTPLKEEIEIDEELQLLFTNNSAYYMYFLLLFKSTLYFAIVTSCLVRTTVTCSNGKNS